MGKISALFLGFLALMFVLLPSQVLGVESSITIGAVLDLTGPAGVYGENVQDGMKIAVETVNESGGLNGQKLKIIYEDTNTDSKTALLATQRLIQKGVPAIIGAVASSTTMVMAPLCQRKGVVLLSPTASNPKITGIGNYIFRVWPSDTFEGSEMAKFALNTIKAKTAAILYINNDYGLGLANIFDDVFTKGGGEVLLKESLGQEATDFRTELTKILRHNPNVVYIPGYTKELSLALRQYREMGIKAKILSSATFESPAVIAGAGKAANGVIFTAPAFSLETEKENVIKYVDAFEKAYGRKPDTIASHGYDAVMVMAEAIKKGGITAKGIRGALMKIKDYPGVTGTMTMEDSGDVMKDIEFKTVKNGKFVKYVVN